MFNIVSLFAAVPCPPTNPVNFLGLLPWWQYLPSSDFATDASGRCNIDTFNIPHGAAGAAGTVTANDIPLVLLAIVDDLLRIAGLIAVGFIISAAFKFITSQGDPEGTAKARQTVINALIGLAVAIVATVFVSYIGNTLGNGS
jgi:hypothetical protein